MNALQVYFKVALACGTPFVFLMDKEYEPLAIAWVIRRVKETWEKWKYIPETHDCDDAAFMFKGVFGHSVGIAFGWRHAWNVILCKDGVWHFEPQTSAFSIERWAAVVLL